MERLSGWQGAGVFARVLCVAAAAVALLWVSGCSSPGRTNNALLSGGLALATFTPNAEIEQIYYLGVIDPLSQVPEAIYRVRVRGQASAMSETKFQTGWVPAWTIDALNGQYTGKGEGRKVGVPQRCDDTENCTPTVGRGLVQFGPEGFRDAPRDQRLVIVMGADPSKFFQAVSSTLNTVSGAKLDKDNAGIRKEMTGALVQAKGDQAGLKAIQVKLLEEGLK
jgi:hypothetical protein